MKIVEFRIPIPLTLEEYYHCQIYSIVKGSKHEVSGGVGLRIVKNEPFSNNTGTGRMTHKELYISGILPNWMQTLMDPKHTILTEMSYNSFPVTKTYYSNQTFTSFVLSIDSNHFSGLVNDDNPLSLPDDILKYRKIINLDIANDGKIVPEEDITTTTLESSDLLPIPKDWIEKYKKGEEVHFKMMTCVKLVTISMPYFGLLGSKIENFIMNLLKDQLTAYHRKFLLWHNEWRDLKMNDLRRMEDEVFAKINDNFYKTFGKIFPNEEINTPVYTNSVLELKPENDEIKPENNTYQPLFPDTKDSETYTGYLLKLGGLFFNSSWNMRYIVLSKNMLYYYDGKDDTKPKDSLNLTGSKIHWLGEYYGRNFVFSIHPIDHSPIYLSADTEKSAKKWILILQLRSEEHSEKEDSEPEKKSTTHPLVEEPRKGLSFILSDNGIKFSPLHRAFVRLSNAEKIKPNFQGTVTSDLKWYDHLLWFFFTYFVKYSLLLSKHLKYRYSPIFLIKPKFFIYYFILTLVCHLSQLSTKYLKSVFVPFNTTPNDFYISFGNVHETFENLEKIFLDKTINHTSKIDLTPVFPNKTLYNLISKCLLSPYVFNTISHTIKFDSKTLIIITQIDNEAAKTINKADIEELINLSKSTQIDTTQLQFTSKILDFDELIKNVKRCGKNNTLRTTHKLSSGFELILIRAEKKGCRIAIYSGKIKPNLDIQPIALPGIIFSKQFLHKRITPWDLFAKTN